MSAPDDLNVTAQVPSSPATGSSTLAVALADRLRDMIIEGELPAGTRLNERALCDRLGASRTPLREAFMFSAASTIPLLFSSIEVRSVADFEVCCTGCQGILVLTSVAITEDS